jgi:membrane fusion protein, multidrug efflux system
MKNTYIIVALSVLIWSCGKNNTDKKSELDNLLKQQSELNAQIKKLQSELDTVSNKRLIPVKIETLKGCNF